MKSSDTDKILAEVAKAVGLMATGLAGLRADERLEEAYKILKDAKERLLAT